MTPGCMSNILPTDCLFYHRLVCTTSHVNQPTSVRIYLYVYVIVAVGLFEALCISLPPALRRIVRNVVDLFPIYFQLFLFSSAPSDSSLATVLAPSALPRFRPVAASRSPCDAAFLCIALTGRPSLMIRPKSDTAADKCCKSRALKIGRVLFTRIPSSQYSCLPNRCRQCFLVSIQFVATVAGDAVIDRKVSS
jgi:hypothetical protein